MKIPELPRASGAQSEKPADAALAEAGLASADMRLDGMSVVDLLKLHARIEAALPPLTLKDVSLEKTLMLQLLAAQELQRDTMEDGEATPTQKSQVTNTLSGVIDTLSKLQIKLFSSERMKDIEGCLIDTINEHMEPAAREFFMEEYRRRLGGARNE